MFIGCHLAVQEMRRERSEKYFKPPQEKQFFQGKIVCEQCGWRYRKHQKDREWYWKCGKKGLTSEVCHAPLLSDKEIRRAFVRMFNTLKQNEKTVIRVGQDGSLTFALKCELKLRVKR